MNELLSVTQASAVASFPIKLKISDEIQANRRPVAAVLFRAGVLSIAPPYGSSKRVLIDRQAIEKLDLDKIVGLPFHANSDLSSHWEDADGSRKRTIAIGAIVDAERKDNVIIGHGFLWDLDFPDIVAKVREASEREELAISWEMVDVVMKDEGDYYRIYSFVPTGFALLRSEFAAYKDLMPALAALHDKEHYDPTRLKLAVLLDDHRILHAYYATMRRGGSISGWTISEIVKLHAGIVDEMLLRHVQHRRGDGLSRALNEESLPLQQLQFFTDELMKGISDIWKVDKRLAAKFVRSAAKHERIQLEEVDTSVPLNVPIGIQVDEGIIGIGAVTKRDGSLWLSLPLTFKRPISIRKIQASVNQWREKLKLASELIDSLPDVIVLSGYIAVTGSSLLTKNAKDLDLLICDNGTFRKLRSHFDRDIIHITLTDKPAGLSIPIYDVVLVKNVRSPIEPFADLATEQLAEHVTVVVEDKEGFVAARMRSLGDLDIYPESAYICETLPTKRGLLKVTQESAEIHTDEGEIIDLTYLLACKPSSCLSLVAEVWNVDGDWMVADCLWWNATKVADLPFPWRLSFVRKIAEAFMMPVVRWRQIFNPDEVRDLRAFVLQDSQAVYGATRSVVLTTNK